MTTFDAEGLILLDPQAWRKPASDGFRYRGGPNGRLFLSYAIGQEGRAEQASILPPPSLQNWSVVLMYARRDNLTCHLCGGAVVLDATDPSYERLRPSPDHLTPRSLGGSDYPSNIGTAHLSCNKARGNKPIHCNLSEDA